jgi:hypothetical protein
MKYNKKDFAKVATVKRAWAFDRRYYILRIGNAEIKMDSVADVAKKLDWLLCGNAAAVLGAAEIVMDEHRTQAEKAFGTLDIWIDGKGHFAVDNAAGTKGRKYFDTAREAIAAVEMLLGKREQMGVDNAAYMDWIMEFYGYGFFRK